MPDFDALQVTGKAARSVMIVIDGYKGKVTIEEAPPDDEAFDLERASRRTLYCRRI